MPKFQKLLYIQKGWESFLDPFIVKMFLDIRLLLWLLDGYNDMQRTPPLAGWEQGQEKWLPCK